MMAVFGLLNQRTKNINGWKSCHYYKQTQKKTLFIINDIIVGESIDNQRSPDYKWADMSGRHGNNYLCFLT